MYRRMWRKIERVSRKPLSQAEQHRVTVLLGLGTFYLREDRRKVQELEQKVFEAKASQA